MNEAASLEALKVLLATFGGSGVAFFVAWLMWTSFKATLKEKDVLQNARIQALEGAANDCASDRRELHKQMHDLQRTVIAANTEALHQIYRQLEPRRDGANPSEKI